MTFHCSECGNLLENGYPCTRCKHDPDFTEKSRDSPFAFDGGGECGIRSCDRSPAYAVEDGPRVRSRCGRHALEELQGIGPAKAEKLWNEFGNLDEIIDEVSVGSYASSPRIARLDGFSPDAPKRLRSALQDVGLLEDSDDQEIVTDGGRDEWSFADHLEAALEKAEGDEIRYHIRAALQYEALIRGEVDWTGSYGPANGGVVD